MKQSKFQMLTRMQDKKTLNKFNAKLCHISNQAFAPEEEYSNSKIIW